MPVHGIRLDLEFATIVAGALAASYFITGQVVSNFLFSTLLGTLFFLMGLHLEPGKLRQNIHKKTELGLGLIMVYLFVPILAYTMSLFFNGPISQALLAVGVSTAAIGSPVVWSNIGKGDDGSAFMIAVTSLVSGMLMIPLLLMIFGAEINLIELFAKNILVIGAPLGLGISAQKYNNTVFNDMKHHFSKLALWLLVLILGIQGKIVYTQHGLSFINSIWAAIPVFIIFTLISYGAGYYSAKKFGLLEKTSRSIGFVTGSKGIAVALFVAAQFSGEAVIAVSTYYFIRQGVCGGIAEYYRHSGDLERIINSFKPAF